MKRFVRTITVVTFLSLSIGAPSVPAQGLPQSFPPLAGPQEGPPFRPAHPIVIVGGLMIDGTGGRPRHDQALVVQGELIRWIGPMEDVRIPEGSEIETWHPPLLGD